MGDIGICTCETLCVRPSGMSFICVYGYRLGVQVRVAAQVRVA